MERRRALLGAVTLVAAASIIARLGWIQVVQRDWYLERVIQQRVHTIEVPVRRGDIVDRNGLVVATSLMKTTVFVDPRDADPGAVATVLAPILGRSEEALLEAIGSHPTYVEIARGLDVEVADRVAAAIREHGLQGVGFFEEPVRYYPMGSLAAHVIGFVGERPDRPRDRVGLAGVELSYEEHLHGQNGLVIAERNALQQEIPGAARLEVRGVDGDHVQLTLDMRLQSIVEEELARQIAETRAKRGAVIIMDPYTGEILAMASLPSFDPNRLDEADAVNLFNFPISGVYEPGSSWKALTVAIAREEGLIQDGELFDCADSITIRDGDAAVAVIRDWSPGGFGMQPVEGVLGYSCNPGTIMIGMRITPEVRRAYMERLGIINPPDRLATGVDLPGEGKEMIQPEVQFNTNISQATMSIGQGFAVTPLQMLTAFATIANGGYRVQPHVVRQVTSPDGTVRFSYPTSPLDRVFSEDTTAVVRRGVLYVVENGTASLAKVPGYKVGGKTSTAEKVVEGQEEAGYARGRYYAAFAGIAPIDRPAFVMLVVLDEPETHQGYGGMNAAPLFSRIARRALPLLGVEPDDKEVIPWSTAEAPDVTGMLVSQASAMLRTYGDRISFVVEGTGEWVRSQDIVDAGGKPEIRLFTVPLHDSDGYWRIPDLTGMTEAEVRALLDPGLPLQFYGEGTVIGQSLAPGSRARDRTPLVIWLGSEAEDETADPEASSGSARPGYPEVSRGAEDITAGADGQP